MWPTGGSEVSESRPRHVEHLKQGFSKSTFKGPNLNFHQCQRSEPEQLVITKVYYKTF